MKSWLVGTLALVAGNAWAFDGLEFQHKDWYLACDNTGTCRVAGYQKEGPSIAVQFTREAGPATPISAKIFYGEVYDDAPWPQGVALYIDGQDLGGLGINQTELSDWQISALLGVVTKSANIEIKDKQTSWRLSDSGASAIFRKMDEYQGRIGTPFAVVAKGKKPESSVPAAKPIPTIVNRAPASEAETLAADSAEYAHWQSLLRESLNAEQREHCSALYREDWEMDFHDLGGGKRLVSSVCWFGAYNYAQAYWLVSDSAPNEVAYLDGIEGDYIKGEIFASHKGSGLGDCRISRAWVYDGKEFVLSSERSTGLCRQVWAGGIDGMPSWVSNVITQADDE